MEKIKSQIENPKGLHARFNISKVKAIPNPNYSKSLDRWNGDVEKDWNEFIETEEDVDPKAEYFVLRLDTGGSDIEHIKACRIGIHAYAMAIQASIPELAKDLIERYPLL